MLSHFRGINNVFGSLRGEGIEGMRGKEGKWYLLPLFGCYYKIKYEEGNTNSSFIWMF